MRKKKFVIATIIWILCLNLQITLNFFIISQYGAQNYQIKNNAGELLINTPENKTYFAPYSGYYPSTYGFENDNEGDNPEGWVIDDESAGNIEVIEELYGHKNVLKIPDDYQTRVNVLYQSFGSDISAGTVEFWILARDSSFFPAIEPLHIQIGDEKAGNPWEHASVLHFGLDEGISVSDGGTSIEVYPDLLINTWYHLKIEFDCTDNWHLWVNGIQTDISGYDFRGNPTSMTLIRFSTGNFDAPLTFIDALGYSWDSKYNIGDNRFEGLFISYDTIINFDWEAYSIDGSTNNTILGDTVIAMPDFGQHTIQIFGKDSIGDVFESDIRHFSTSPLNLIEPKNITYTEPTRRYYPGTYSFENVKDGLDPPDWIDLGGESCVISEFERHKKVMKLFYPGGGDHTIDVRNMFETTPESGTIEFWLAQKDANAPIEAHFRNLGVGICFSLRMNNDAFQFYNGTWHPVGKNALDRNWYHIRIDFETTIESYMGLSQWKWRLFINNELFGPYNFNYQVAPNFFRFYAGILADTSYVDAIGYSWDPNYNVGSNLKEGFLLDFEYSPYLEWIGYSLDGQMNKQIRGNTVIPLPSNKSHSIQIFGNDSLGYNYYSELCFFTIEYPIEIFTLNPGTWEDLFSIYFDSDPKYVFIGDADNDGYNDIVVGTYITNKIKILTWNDTIKSWNPPISKDTGTTPYEISIGDANNDGYNDIVVANFKSDTISIFLWNESLGDWDSHIRSAGDGPYNTIIGDGNNDGFNDIIISNHNSNDVSVFLWNDTISNWNSPITKAIGSYTNSLALGDINNDGDKDIITTSTGDDKIHILLWNSSLNDWSPIEKHANQYPTGLSVGDVNNDGFNDMIVADAEGEGISIFLWNESLGDWDSFIKSTGDYPRETFIEDVNNDGYNDITVVAGGYLSILLWNNRFNRWQEEIKKSTGNNDNVGELFIGDLNNDGFNDILMGTQFISDHDIRIYLWNRAPIITIKSPQEKDAFGIQAPNFTIEIKDNEFSSLWFKINKNEEKIPFNGNGTIDKTLWENLDDGTIKFKFFANDTWGGIGFTVINLQKDVVSPLITIKAPTDGNIFGKDPPQFNITIYEANSYSLWYTIDNGITNYTIYELWGFINQSAWDSALPGDIIIKFYAKDLAENIGTNEVIIVKEDGSSEFPLELILLISFISGGAIIGIAVFLLVKRKRTL